MAENFGTRTKQSHANAGEIGDVSGNAVLPNGRLCGSTCRDQNGRDVNAFCLQTGMVV